VLGSFDGFGIYFWIDPEEYFYTRKVVSLIDVLS
jgi:hypothetical protein